MQALRIAFIPLARPTFDIPLAKQVTAAVRTQLEDAGYHMTGPHDLVMDLAAAEAAAEELTAVDHDAPLSPEWEKCTGPDDLYAQATCAFPSRPIATRTSHSSATRSDARAATWIVTGSSQASFHAGRVRTTTSADACSPNPTRTYAIPRPPPGSAAAL